MYLGWLELAGSDSQKGESLSRRRKILSPQSQAEPYLGLSYGFTCPCKINTDTYSMYISFCMFHIVVIMQKICHQRIRFFRKIHNVNAHFL